MSRHLTVRVAMMAAVLAMLAAGLVWAQAPAAGTPATAAKAPAVAKDVQAAGADQEKEKGPAEKAAVLKKVIEQVRAHVAVVATRWQKDQGELPDGTAEGHYGVRDIGSLVEQKMSSDELGVMIDPAQGLVAAPDEAREPRFMESVKALMADGKECPVKLHGFYRDLDLAVYKAKSWPGPQAPLAWFTGEVGPFKGPSYMAGLGRDRSGWDVVVSPGSGGRFVQRAGSAELEEQLTRDMTRLAFDEEGRPLGFVRGRFSLTGERFPWRGGDLQKQKLVTLEEFEKIKARTLERSERYVREIKIVYRQPEEKEGNLEFESEDPTSLTQYYYGYAISPTRFLVPWKMEKIYVQRFKSITVELDGREAPAKFVGAYLNFGGFVVELAEGASPGVLPAESAAVPDLNRAALTYLAERKFGKRRNTVWYNRIGEFEKGYNDRLWPTTGHPLARGTLLLDFDGRPIGLCLIERRPEEEKKGEQQARYRYRSGREAELRLYTMADLADALKNPQQHLDPNLQPANEQEEKRLVWLGVEFQSVGAMLAEMLDQTQGGDQTRKLTRGGEVGLRVTCVFKNSPAEQAGLAVGDILLEIKEAGKDKPIELKPAGDYSPSFSYGGYGRRSYSRPAMFGASNYLTQLLTRLGPGAKITLVYLHDKEKLTHDFTLEWAPYDFDSARKYKDEKAGLTVKELTYEVRSILKLPDDQPGVIVAKIEDGQKAEIARIEMFNIITDINGKPVKDVKDFEAKMSAIENAPGGGTAVLALLWLGKSHIVRIQFP